MTSEPAADQAQAQAFMGKVFGDLAGTMATLMCVFGEHFGLFRTLAADGPLTAEELAARAGIDARYALPPEHAAPLVGEAGPTSGSRARSASSRATSRRSARAPDSLAGSPIGLG